MQKISCPVCDRPEVEGNVCTNCETDLSTVRMLLELPPVPEETTAAFAISQSPLWLVAITILLLLLGGVLGSAAMYWLTPQSVSVIPTNTPTPIVQPIQPTEITPKKLCSEGFYYQVRRGDSLYAIAGKFYGDGTEINPIVQANPQLSDRPDSLTIGEVLLIPNRQEYYCGNL